MVLLILLIVLMVLLICTYFLGSQMLKKFGFVQKFVENSNELITWSCLKRRKSGMYNIVIRSENPFCGLIGFKLKVAWLKKYTGFDYFGFIDSKNRKTVVISTYFGKKGCEFQFLVNARLRNNKISISSTARDQNLKPDYRFNPHWYQKLRKI